MGGVVDSRQREQRVQKQHGVFSKLLVSLNGIEGSSGVWAGCIFLGGVVSLRVRRLAIGQIRSLDTWVHRGCCGGSGASPGQPHSGWMRDSTLLCLLMAKVRLHSARAEGCLEAKVSHG